MGGALVDFNDPTRLEQEAVEKFVQCASNVRRVVESDARSLTMSGEQSGSTNRSFAWYVATDSNVALEMLRKISDKGDIEIFTYDAGRRIHTDSFRESHLFVNSADYAQVFVDWLMLAQSDFLVLTRSTFGFSAKDFGQVPWQLLNVDGTSTNMVVHDYHLCFPKTKRSVSLRR